MSGCGGGREPPWYSQVENHRNVCGLPALRTNGNGLGEKFTLDSAEPCRRVANLRASVLGLPLKSQDERGEQNTVRPYGEQGGSLA